MIWVSVVLICLLAAWILLPRFGWMPSGKAAEVLRSGGVLIDVRTPEEYAIDRIEGVENIPLGKLEEGVRRAGWSPEKPILLHCASGIRSETARRQLQALGFTEAANLGSFSRAKKIAAAASRSD